MNNHVGKADTALNLRAIALIRDAYAPADRRISKEVAARAGIPDSTLRNIVRPNGAPRRITIDVLVGIAIALGADPVAWVSELESLAKELGLAKPPIAGRSTLSGTESDDEDGAARAG